MTRWPGDVLCPITELQIRECAHCRNLKTPEEEEQDLVGDWNLVDSVEGPDPEPLIFTCACGQVFTLLGAKFRHMQECVEVKKLRNG